MHEPPDVGERGRNEWESIMLRLRPTDYDLLLSCTLFFGQLCVACVVVHAHGTARSAVLLALLGCDRPDLVKQEET